MIAITNRGKVMGQPSDSDLYEYQVEIASFDDFGQPSRQFISSFHHHRSEGLSKCLKLAAKSVEEETKKLAKISFGILESKSL